MSITVCLCAANSLNYLQGGGHQWVSQPGLWG